MGGPGWWFVAYYRVWQGEGERGIFSRFIDLGPLAHQEIFLSRQTNVAHIPECFPSKMNLVSLSGTHYLALYGHFHVFELWLAPRGETVGKYFETQYTNLTRHLDPPDLEFFCECFLGCLWCKTTKNNFGRWVVWSWDSITEKSVSNFTHFSVKSEKNLKKSTFSDKFSLWTPTHRKFSKTSKVPQIWYWHDFFMFRLVQRSESSGTWISQQQMDFFPQKNNKLFFFSPE